MHNHTLKVALAGLLLITAYKLFFTNFNFVTHLGHEWEVLVNLFALLIGFALLARHFEETRLPLVLPHYLPDDWKGGFVLLALVFVLSSFLDNIAAAMIGGAIALTVFKGKVHIGYIAAIVAASNGGGSGSVLGDTTTTMLWIAHISPSQVFPAYIGSVAAFLFYGVIASRQQHKFNPILKESKQKVQIDWLRLAIVMTVLIAAVVTNVLLDFPAVGVWGAILVGAFFRQPDWKEAKHAVPGAMFLLSLVLAASMMPVESLPAASWQTTFGLGFVSAVFDNIPLTKLAIEQGGYDWGMLAYAVGFGGSMLWFGSSSGVAITGIYPEAKSVGGWLKNGWHVVVAYLIGMAAILLLNGWNP